MNYLLLHVKQGKKRLCAYVGLALFFLCPVTAPALEVHNSEYGFTLQVPDEFETFDFLAVLRGQTRQLVEKTMLYAFVSGGTRQDPRYTHLLIERSSVWMTSVPVPMENRSVMENAWQGIDIYLYRHEDGFQQGEPTRVTLTAAIPLETGPIQIKLSGPPEKENQMMAILNSTLRSLQAEASLFAGTSKYSYLLVPLGGLLAFSVYAGRNAG